MPTPRPYWKGYLKLSLVSCPIAVHSATSSAERVAFRQINRETGNRLKQQLVDEYTGDVVEAGDKGRGYETARHEYMLVEDEELDAVAIESSHTIDIDCAPKSTSGISTAPTTSYRRARSARGPSRSSARPSAARTW